MCCCGKPTINGELAYRWNDSSQPAGIYPVNPPTLQGGDVLLFDEPGRCGGLDSHAYHFSVVKRFSSLHLLVRHGGGDEQIRLYPHRGLPDMFEAMDSNTRYWVLATIYSASNQAARAARDSEAETWRKAAAEGRLKTRKQRGQNRVKVWIDHPTLSLAAS